MDMYSMLSIWVLLLFFVCEFATIRKVLSPLQSRVIYTVGWPRVEAIQLRKRGITQYGHSDYGYPDLLYRRGISPGNMECLSSTKLTLPWILNLPVFNAIIKYATMFRGMIFQIKKVNMPPDRILIWDAV